MSEVTVREKRVTVVQPTLQPLTQLPLKAIVRRKVAGYARVSTDSEEQESSYEAQVDYFTDYIKSHDDWQFVKVYTDEECSYPGLLVKNLPPCKKVGLTYENYLMIGVNSSKFARCIQLVGKGL